MSPLYGEIRSAKLTEYVALLNWEGKQDQLVNVNNTSYTLTCYLTTAVFQYLKSLFTVHLRDGNLVQKFDCHSERITTHKPPDQLESGDTSMLNWYP